MRVIPAIDLQEGKCVRLLQGDFAKSTEYSNDPLAIARQFSELDVSDLHIVDLDGARTGSQENTHVIRGIADLAPFDIQLGGGIRSEDTVRHWFDNGVDRCVIGSLAILDPVAVKSWFKTFGAKRIVLALDVTVVERGDPLIATHGWTATSDTTLWQCLQEYGPMGLVHVLCTDISRDGALVGPNVELYADMMRRYPRIQLQASGGVRNYEDLMQLRQLGIPAAITGRALLDGKISAQEVASFRRSA